MHLRASGIFHPIFDFDDPIENIYRLEKLWIIKGLGEFESGID